MNQVMDFDRLFDERGVQKTIFSEKGFGGEYCHDGEKCRYLSIMDRLTRKEEQSLPVCYLEETAAPRLSAVVPSWSFNDCDRSAEEERYCFFTVSGIFAAVLGVLVTIALL